MAKIQNLPELPNNNPLQGRIMIDIPDQTTKSGWKSYYYNFSTGKFGIGSDNVELNNEGITLNGDAIQFNDMVFSALQSKQGANLKPDFDFTEVGALFPQNDTSEILYIIAQLPHSYKEGSTVYPHVHYRQTSALVPIFKIDYKWFNIGEQIPANFTTLEMDTVAIPYTSGSIQQINNGVSISGIGKKISSIMLIKLYRDDNIVNGDVLTYQFDIHHEIDSFGSKQEYIK
jgi:hypothetical protein